MTKQQYNFDATYKCPKCSGLTYTAKTTGEANVNKCAVCGLHLDLGGPVESLKKQLLVDNYINPLGGNA